LMMFGWSSRTFFLKHIDADDLVKDQSCSKTSSSHTCLFAQKKLPAEEKQNEYMFTLW